MPCTENAPDWYYPQWLAEAPHAPVFKVRDTVNKYGRYASEPKIITLKDLIKFHGHFCGGLVEGATVLRVAFDHLFPDGIIDRTDLMIASNNSACGGDIAAYLTGARARFGVKLAINPLIWASGLGLLYYHAWRDPAPAGLDLATVAWLHTVGAFMMLIFLIVHVYLTTTGHTPLAHIRAMISGYEDVDD